METITFAVDRQVLEAVRRRARDDRTTLEVQFRRWLADYSGQEARMARYDAVIQGLKGKLRVGRKLTREERNED